MSLALASKLVFENREGGFSIFSVQTFKCLYRVVVDNEGCCRVQGPGVDEEIDVGPVSQGLLSMEAQALFAVLLFEESD